MLAPLQGGSDVITRTATKRINWAAYKINQATDRVGVFVSIVSTKIPYKGAGKEYICAPSAVLGALSALLTTLVYVVDRKSLTSLALCAADDMDAMVAAVKQAIMHCCLQVRTAQPMRPCIKLHGRMTLPVHVRAMSAWHTSALCNIEQ